MMERCSDCPSEGRCVVEWTGHRPFCDWARRGGPHRDRVRELSAGGPGAPIDGREAPQPRPITATLEMLARMRRCPFWSRCSCQGGRCGLRRGAIVGHRECFECLTRFPEPETAP